MRLMLVSDFAQVRRSIVSTLLVCLFVMAVMTVSGGMPVAGAATVAVCFPYITVHSVLANDEVAGWTKLRETMPLTRRDVVLGRYAGALLAVVFGCVLAVAMSLAAGMLLDALGLGAQPQMVGEEAFLAAVFASTSGSAAALTLLAIILPLVMWLGLTRTARVLPLVFVFAFVGAFGMMGEGSPEAVFSFASLPAIGLGVMGVALILFALSAAVIYRLYKRRLF